MQPNTSMPLGWQRISWLALMVAASVAFSLGFACAAPLAAFGAMSALTLDRRTALLFTGAVWLANQVTGYAILDYPITSNSLAWGAALGVSAIFAMLAARWSSTPFTGLSRAATPVVAFAAAFAAYEVTLFAAALTLLGGTEDFTVAIVARILAINALAMLALLILDHLGSHASRLPAPDLNGLQNRLPN
jgi:hypothetical protein